MDHPGPYQSPGEDGQAPPRPCQVGPRGRGGELAADRSRHPFGEMAKAWTESLCPPKAQPGKEAAFGGQEVPQAWVQGAPCPPSPKGRPSLGRWAPARPHPEAPQTGFRGVVRGRGLREPRATALGSCRQSSGSRCRAADNEGTGLTWPRVPPAPHSAPSHVGSHCHVLAGHQLAAELTGTSSSHSPTSRIREKAALNREREGPPRTRGRP